MQYTIKYIQKRIMIHRIDMQPKSGSSHYKIGASVIDTTPALVRCRHGLPAMWHFHWNVQGGVAFSQYQRGLYAAMARMGCPRDAEILHFHHA